MKQHRYYTIITHKHFFTIKYTVVPEGRVLTFPGTFDTAQEAEEAFKKAVQGKLEQLPEKAFERKADDLHSRYKQDLAKLTDWNTGRTIRI